MGGTTTQTSGQNATPFNANGLAHAIGTSLTDSFNKGPKVFDESLYAGLSPKTTASLNTINQFATDPNSVGGLKKAIANNNTLQVGGGLTPTMKGNLSALGGIGTMFGSLAKPAGPSLTEQQLLKTAQGGDLKGTNPYFEGNLQDTIGDVSTSVNASLGANGRLGGSPHVQELAREVGRVSNTARQGQYQFEQQRRDAAIAAIEGQRQQQFGNRVTALQGQQGAAQAGFGAGQVGVSNSSQAGLNARALYEASLVPGQTQLGIGSAMDADAQAKLLARNDLFRRQNDAARDWGLGYVGGLGQLNGSSGANSATQPETPWWQTALSTGIGLGSLFI